jgi:hypothetical protein
LLHNWQGFIAEDFMKKLEMHGHSPQEKAMFTMATTTRSSWFGEPRLNFIVVTRTKDHLLSEKYHDLFMTLQAIRRLSTA